MSSPMDLLEILQELNVQDQAVSALSDHEEDIATQIAGQLSAGVNGDGSEIVPEYAFLTVQLKQGKPGLSGVTDRVTLFDTGSHYRELYAEVEKTGEVETGSRDEKSLDLQAKYGEGIYQPGETARQNVIDEGLAETWQGKITEATGLKFD
jgi:hypothetical protein